MSENEVVEAVLELTQTLSTDSSLSVEALPEVNPNFNGVTFWLHLYVESQKVGRAATKLMLVHSVPPAPAAAHVLELLAELRASYSALASCYLTLPRQRGLQLAKTVTSCLTSLRSSLLHFLQLFVTAVKDSSGCPRVCNVGVVLEDCKQVCRLPNDNRQAVMGVLQVDHDLMVDTVDEITAEVKNQMNVRRSGKQGVVSVEEEAWSDSELKVVSLSLRLAKLGRSTTQTALNILQTKGGAECGTERGAGGAVELPTADSVLDAEETALLDEVASHSSQLSPLLDDLFAFIYPPVDTDSLPPLVDKFVGSLRSLVGCLQRFPLLEPPHTELLSNLRVELEKTSAQLTTLLVSNDILRVSQLSIV